MNVQGIHQMIQSKITKTLSGTWEEILALKDEILTNSTVQLLVYEPIAKKPDDLASLRQAVIEDFHKNYEFVREPAEPCLIPDDIYENIDVFHAFVAEFQKLREYRNEQWGIETMRENARDILLSLRENAKEYGDAEVENELTEMLELKAWLDYGASNSPFGTYIAKLEEHLEKSRGVYILRSIFGRNRGAFLRYAVEALEIEQGSYFGEPSFSELEALIQEFKRRASRFQETLQAQEIFRTNLKNELQEIRLEISNFAQFDDRPSDLIARFKACGLTCWIATLHTKADELSLLEESVDQIQDVKREIENIDENYMRKHPIVGDEALWSGPTRLSVERWDSLAYWYGRIKEAREVYEWHIKHEVSLEDILEPVAASVQGLNLVLHQCKKGRQDTCQNQFYQDMLDYAKQNQRYIDSLQDSSLDGLKESASKLKQVLETAQKELRRQQCMNDIEMLFQENPNLGSDVERLESDRALLFPLLDECKNFGIPESNAVIRDLLLENGISLLYGASRYAKILGFVDKARKKKGLDISSIEEPESTEDDDYSFNVPDYIEKVKAYVDEKKILILGGMPKPKTVQKLKQTLSCDVDWAVTQIHNPKSVEQDVLKADIVLAIIKYIGHDLKDESRRLIKEKGGVHISLTTGYGINHIIFKLNEYIERTQPKNPA